MYKTVKAEIARLTRKGVPEDFLLDAADAYSINEDGGKSTARYIINGLREEAEKYFDLLDEGEN